jgi:hypothetical protein
MSSQKYSSYIAKIFKSDDDSGEAEKAGEAMESKFSGAVYEIVAGDPSGQCSFVDGKDPKICKQIKEWVNGRR